MIARRMAALLNVYCGKSVMLVLILSREALKQLALSVVTGDYPCITSYLYCKQRKLWRWSTKKAIVILCVYIYQHTQLKKKYSICKKLGVKKGGRVFAGAVSQVYSTKHTITSTSNMYLGPSCVGECLPERGGRG